jgi:cell division protease FtsH
MTTGPSVDEAREFAAAFRSFLDWVHAERWTTRNEVSELVVEFLGGDRAGHSVVARELPPYEQVNLQAALNAWSRRAEREVTVHGVAVPPHYGDVSLQQLVAGDALPPLRLGAPALVDLPDGPGSTLACLRRALLLTVDRGDRYALLVSGPSEESPGLSVEVAGLPVAEAQALHAELDELRSRLNVYRGQLVDVGVSPMGGMDLNFAAIRATPRDDVVLPETVLARVEQHAFGVGDHRDALVGAGQHLKRGLLLFGPPGTGKTHTTRYVVGRMTGYTRLLLSGRSLAAIGSVAELARELQPAVVVLEDVDLIAEDRSFGPGSSPLLFDLLDAMDGAAADADLMFLLTTNRPDLLEPALAARPGRVDIAVAIGLPDADARARLLDLYRRGVPWQVDADAMRPAVDRTEGVTASFLKELVRRSVLEALRDDKVLNGVTGGQLARALDDLLDSSQTVTRSLLGVGNDPEELPAGGGIGMMPRARMPRGWASYAPRPARRMPRA